MYISHQTCHTSWTCTRHITDAGICTINTYTPGLPHMPHTYTDTPHMQIGIKHVHKTCHTSEATYHICHNHMCEYTRLYVYTKHVCTSQRCMTHTSHTSAYTSYIQHPCSLHTHTMHTCQLHSSLRISCSWMGTLLVLGLPLHPPCPTA